MKIVVVISRWAHFLYFVFRLFQCDTFIFYFFSFSYSATFSSSSPFSSCSASFSCSCYFAHSSPPPSRWFSFTSFLSIRKRICIYVMWICCGKWWNLKKKSLWKRCNETHIEISPPIYKCHLRCVATESMCLSFAILNFGRWNVTKMS